MNSALQLAQDTVDEKPMSGKSIKCYSLILNNAMRQKPRYCRHCSCVRRHYLPAGCTCLLRHGHEHS